MREIVAADSQMSVATFVETKFVPEHVAHKALAGRVHYYSILKHVLRPETVDHLFEQFSKTPNARLRCLPDWPYLDDVKLCDLTPDHVRQLMSAAFVRGYSAQTVRHIRSVISALITHAMNERCLSGKNPVSGVPLPPIIRKRAHNLNVIQVKSVLRLMQYPEREIALITIATGMSISEICGLQWKHVNLTKTALLTDGEMIPPGCILVKQLRNSKGLSAVGSNRRRHVDIPEALLTTLVKLKRRLGDTGPGEFVLAFPSGNSISPVSARYLLLKPIGRKLEMPWLSWQVLQRAHDTLLTALRPQLCDDLVFSARQLSRLLKNRPSRC
jgi:integrase